MNYSKIICGVIAIGMSIALSAQPAKHLHLLIGGYTTSTPENGIAVYDFNTQTGALQFRSVTGNIENPSYIAVSSNKKNVYAVSEKNGGVGTVVAYTFNAASETLQLVNQSSAGGRGPCYISIDDAGKHAFVANYSDGSLAAIAINGDGSLDTASVQSIQHTGSSIDKENQKGPHAHSTVLSPDNRFLLCADLGTDRIYSYRFNAANNQSLNASTPPYVSVAPGSGPRHSIFHPNGKYVYVVNELSGTIDVFDYNEGVLKSKQTITMLPNGFKGIVEAADIHISPDGKFLYASNREVRNELVIYSVLTNGKLAFVGRQPVLGAVPRNFVIDPTGKFLLVANQKTNEVLVFRRNLANGLLHYTGHKITSKAPSCLKFISK
jgi:6-phosphogluconolactonase